jgi:ribosomal protein S18 acetylase RimI-like enzyme
MPADHTIRIAIISDTGTILVVHVAAIITHGPSAYTDKQVAAWAAKTEGTNRYANAIEEPSTELVVAECDGHVVGFGELDVERGEVEAVFVDPEWNGEGIGSSVLRHFEQRLQDEEFDIVRLRAVLNAVGFYEQQGSDKVERVTNQTTNDVEVDSVWMEKSL